MSNVQLMRNLYDAFGRGDIAAVLGAMDPDMEWREAEGNPYQPSGAPWRGPDAIMQNFSSSWAPSGTVSPSTPGSFTMLAPRSLSKVATPGPTSRPAETSTPRSATYGR